MLGLQVSTLSLILVKLMFFALKTDAKYYVVGIMIVHLKHFLVTNLGTESCQR